MSISTRFSVGIHILTLIEINKGEITSESLASSVNTNSAVIRKIMGMLKNAGLVQSHPGIAGAQITRELSEISLFDVYKAVNVVQDKELFSVHGNPNPNCPVGKNIQHTIEPLFAKAQLAMEQVLKDITIQDVVEDINSNDRVY